MDTEFKITDSELIRQTIEGRNEAYDELFARYSITVLKMLTQRCSGDEAQAKDIMQETFIKAFVNIDKFDSKYTFGQWIYTIARNLFIDHTRRKRNSLNEVDVEIPCYQLDPEQRAINRQNGRKIEQAMARLPLNYQRVFELRYLCDMSYEQIAKELSLPIGTVKTHIHRTRERFLKEFGGINFE